MEGGRWWQGKRREISQSDQSTPISRVGARGSVVDACSRRSAERAAGGGAASQDRAMM